MPDGQLRTTRGASRKFSYPVKPGINDIRGVHSKPSTGEKVVGDASRPFRSDYWHANIAVGRDPPKRSDEMPHRTGEEAKQVVLARGFFFFFIRERASDIMSPDIIVMSHFVGQWTLSDFRPRELRIFDTDSCGPPNCIILNALRRRGRKFCPKFTRSQISLRPTATGESQSSIPPTPTPPKQRSNPHS
jgi:hypothetical protein